MHLLLVIFVHFVKVMTHVKKWIRVIISTGSVQLNTESKAHSIKVAIIIIDLSGSSFKFNKETYCMCPRCYVIKLQTKILFYKTIIKCYTFCQSIHHI